MYVNIFFYVILQMVTFVLCNSSYGQNDLRRFIFENKYGFIDTEGRIRIKPKFDYVSERFQDGLAWFSNSDTAGYINPSGEIIIIFNNSKYAFNEGLSPYFDGNKLGFLTTSGENAFYPKFKNYILGSQLISSGIPFYSEGLASVVITKNDSSDWYKFIFIDKNGKKAFGNRVFASASNYFEGLAFVSLNNGEAGYINHKGKFEITLKNGESGERFSNGFAVICDSNNRYYYINKKGLLLGKLIFEKAEAFSDSMAKVKLNGEWGFINSKGELAIKPIYNENSYGFSEGMASVSISEGNDTRRSNTLTYFINKQGEVILGPYKDMVIKSFYSGLAEGILPLKNINGNCTEYFYMNKLGHIIWKDTICSIGLEDK